MVRSYARFLAHPGVVPLTAAALLTRLGTPVLALALLLVAVEDTRSYGVAGLVLTGHALALAACAPVGGRLADRHPPRRVVAGFGFAHLLAYGLLLTVLATSPPVPVLGAAAVLLGATTPPASAVIRGTWPRLVPRESLATAYAVDNAANELMFVAGPLIVTALLPLMPARAIVATAGAAVLSGAALLVGSRSVHRRDGGHGRGADRRDPDRRAGVRPGRRNRPIRRGALGGLAGPLADRPTLALLTVAAGGAFAFGCLRIAVVAAATASGTAAAAGVLMGLLSAGTLAGGLGYGARTWRVPGHRLLPILCLAEGVALLAAAFAPGLLPLAVPICLAGLLAGPRELLEQVLLAERAAKERRTEVFGWLNTFMWGGYGLGTSIAGRVTGPADDGGAALTAAALSAWAAAALAAAGGRAARSRHRAKEDATVPGAPLRSVRPGPMTRHARGDDDQVDIAANVTRQAGLAAELVNLVTPRQRGGSAARPLTGDELVTAFVSLLSERNAARVRAVPDAAGRLTELAWALRGALLAADPAETADRINGLIRRYRAQPYLTRDVGQDFHLHFHGTDDTVVEGLGGEFATMLALIVDGYGAHRFGQCRAHNCDAVYIDLTRNGSRRYCSAACTARAKTAAYRTRRNAGPAGAAST